MKTVEYKGPLAPPTEESSVIPTPFKMLGMSPVSRDGSLVMTALKTPVHVGSVIRVANFAIEIGQITIVFLDDLGKIPNPR
jgi:hypothetical protein